jgi:hypothetical protein
MKAGVVYPQVELGGDTGAVKAFAQAAEDLGYDHIVIYDHVLGAVHAGREPKLTGPYKETDPFHEPLITFAYLAGITKKTRNGDGRYHFTAATNGPVRQAGGRRRPVLGRSAPPWCRGGMELGGV